MKSTVSKVRIVREDATYQLLVNDAPFFIHGAGLEFGSIPKLAATGANALRTWRVFNGERSGREVLDEAHANGLKVMMGIDVGRERHGFDYSDENAVRAQLERIRSDVLDLKDHPALIIWGIGNELNLHAENPQVWNAVNEISKMIHQLDGNHPTTTSLAAFERDDVALITNRSPDLDFLSVQLYGELDQLPKLVEKVRWTGPLLVTEWGATGYWEAKKTRWDAPIEEHSSKKATVYLERYTKGIAAMKHQVLGSFVFLWGQKQERTSTWFGLFTEKGNKTEVVDVMQQIWTDRVASESCPRIESLKLNQQLPKSSVSVKPSALCDAVLQLKGDAHQRLFTWEVLNESESRSEGGDFEEAPKKAMIQVKSSDKGRFAFEAPSLPGAYRLYVYVDSKDGYTAHANFPFMVEE